jgi:hypothetical protein
MYLASQSLCSSSGTEKEDKMIFRSVGGDDDHVNWVRLRLWTAATNCPIVHPPGDKWAWRTMVEWCRQGKTPDSSTRALSGNPASRAI